MFTWWPSSVQSPKKEIKYNGKFLAIGEEGNSVENS